MPEAKMNWKPRRYGQYYCSPSCGANCTYEEFLQANELAGELARRLGVGWKPVVHENMKWYWRVALENDLLTVSNHTHEGIVDWSVSDTQVIAHSNTSPEEALSAYLSALDVKVERIQAQRARIREALGVE